MFFFFNTNINDFLFQIKNFLANFSSKIFSKKTSVKKTFFDFFLVAETKNKLNENTYLYQWKIK